MKKSLSALMGLSMALTALPVFADTEATGTASTSSSSSVSSSVDARPCFDKTGEARVICLREEATKRVDKKNPDRTNTRAKDHAIACGSKTGLEKALCLRGRLLKQQVEKKEAQMDKMHKKITPRALRNAVKDLRAKEHKGWMRSSKSSMSSSSSSSSMSSSTSSASSN